MRRCVNGRRASFAIDAPHKNLKFFAALESATHRYELDVVEPGTYACSYVVAAPPGAYELSILLDDEYSLPGSPFATTVAAGEPSALAGSNEAAPGERIDLDVRDAYGHATAFDLRVEGPATAAGNAVSVRLDAAPGAEVLVHATRDGRPIRGSPLAVRVVPAAAAGWVTDAPEPPPPMGPPRRGSAAWGAATSAARGTRHRRRGGRSAAPRGAVRGDADVATLSADAALRGLFAPTQRPRRRGASKS